MKKILLVMLLILGLSLTGCGSNGSSSSSGSSDQQQSKNTQQTKDTNQTEGKQQADDPAAYYKGKTINFIVPYNPGGGYDTYSRMLAPYFEKYTGATVVVRNVPGAGGLVGTNQVWETKDDLTVSITNNIGLISAVLAQAEGIKFDLKKFTWLGRIVADAKALTVNKDFPINDGKDLKNLGRPFKMGATGKGSSNFLDAVVMQEVTGLPMDIVTGYESSSEIDLSITRGEVDGTCGSYSSRIPAVNSGDQKMLLLLSGKIPDQAKYTALKDLAVNDEALKIYKAYEGMQSSGRAVIAPPGVSEARAKFLSDAFKKAMQDSEAIAQFKKGKREIDYATGDEVKSLVIDALDAPQKFADLLKENIK